MSKRLLQIAKELGVGLNTAVEFLQKKGHDVPANPNYNITEEEQSLLIKEFKPDMEMKSSAEEISRQRHEKGKHATVAIEGYEDKKKEKAPEIKTEIPQNQIPKITTVGKIDLDKLNKPAKPAQQNVTTNEAPAVAKKTETPAEKPAEKIEKPVEEVAASVSDKLADPEKTETVSPVNDNRSDLMPNIKVLGKVDLDSLNQQTRPKKKSKEEKKRERDARFNHDKGQNNNGGQQNANNGGDDSKRQRQRISTQKERIDVDNYKPSSNEKTSNGPRPGKQHKSKHGKPMSDEDLMRSASENIRKTKAELFTKQMPNKNSAKHRHDKREQAAEQRRKQEENEELEKGILRVTEFVTVSDVATMMNVPVVQVISKCMQLGQMVSINQRLDAEVINLVASEFGFTTEYISAEVAEAIQEEEDKPEDLMNRPPVVTVMGHVDHGKTSLLDYIRNTNVIAGEAGGITQHIGAYNVTLQNGQQISFLDTPGHEAFTAMRARGAQVADVAIIIVAADDDVMPQTVEAINHASNAGIPIVFAINKVDKPAANADKIREALAAMNYLVEDWGGKYQCQEISAKKGMGVEELMEKVLLEAEMLELKANPNRKASGIIIESQLEKGRGYTSTVLVNNGTLRVGDSVVAGKHYGKVKAMYNERNQKVDKAGPSEPVLVLGLNGAPTAGEKFNVFADEKEAKEVAELIASGRATDGEPEVLDCGKYAGMTTAECRKVIVEDLRAGGYLKEIEPLKHEVGTCYRCHSTIEPMVSKQWFVRMVPLAEPAIESVEKGEIKFVPERFTNAYLNWMRNTRDWCISRQLWWGHQIPAFYCDDCGEIVVTKDAEATCPKCGKKMRQDPDTLDTWFSSALWPFCWLASPDRSGRSPSCPSWSPSMA